MISFLSRSVVRSLIKNDMIEMEKAEVYQYGFEILISTTLGLLLYLQRFGKYAEDIMQIIIGAAIYCSFW